MEEPGKPVSGDVVRYREQAALARRLAAAAERDSREEDAWLDIEDAYDDLADIAENRGKHRRYRTARRPGTPTMTRSPQRKPSTSVRGPKRRPTG
jgi:hypothetical protein